MKRPTCPPSGAPSDSPPASLDTLGELLRRRAAGDARAEEALVPIVYDELRALADRQMRRERAGATLQPTALAHEVWLRLANSARPFEDRAHFFGAAARAMRQILVDHARRARRGGPTTFVEPVAPTSDGLDVLDLEEALRKLEERDASKASVVTLRFLLGCTVRETAVALACSPAKVKKDWAFARAWLRCELTGWADNDGL